MFDLNHIFICFAQGSGGNFVTALMQKIINYDFTLLPINKYGSFHILNNGKREGKDSISFGSSIEENRRFLTVEEKENFYLQQIKEEYTVPQQIITWTHDYSNLPLYKKHFSKSKTLSLILPTKEEILMSVMMHVNKVFLADEKYIPVNIDLWEWGKDRMLYHLNYNLKKILGEDVNTKEIFIKRMTDEYVDIMFYLIVKILLSYANLKSTLNIIDEEMLELKYVDAFKNSDENAFLLYNNKDQMLRTTETLDYKTIIIKNSDGILSLNQLIKKDFLQFKKSYSDTLNRRLYPIEEDYLEESLIDYCNRQDDFLIRDPIGYFKNRKKIAFAKINSKRIGV